MVVPTTALPSRTHLQTQRCWEVRGSASVVRYNLSGAQPSPTAPSLRVPVRLGRGGRI